jgi:hypothetical protein
VKYRKDEGSKPIPVLVDQALRDRIAAMSERMGEPKSTVMRIAMRIGLEQLEKTFDADLGKTSSSSNYPPHRDQTELAEERPPKKKTA